MSNNTSCDYLPRAVLEQMPGFLTWMDKENRCLGTNLLHARMHGFGSIDAMIGMHIKESLSSIGDYPELIEKQNQAVIEHNKMMCTLEMHRYVDGNLYLLMAQKTPLKDIAQKNIGVICHGIFVPLSLWHHFALPGQVPAAKTFFDIQDFNESLHFSKRESECLFYLLRGQTARGIANKLEISCKTVEFYISCIRHKMNCQNKTQLIEKSIELGYLSVIPKELWMAGI